MIYIIRQEGSNYVKIGYTSNNVYGRIKAAQTYNPFKLHVIAKFDGGIQREYELQKKYSEYSTNGGLEWFKFPKNIIDELILLDDKSIIDEPIRRKRIGKRNGILNVVLNIRTSPDDLERLLWLSKTQGKSQGTIVRELIDREYNRVKTAVAAQAE